MAPVWPPSYSWYSIMSPLYGVVVCPRCRTAKGCNLRQKTTKCPCGDIIDLKVSRVYFKTSRTRELAKAVAAQNAKLHGGLEEYKKAAELSRDD